MIAGNEQSLRSAWRLLGFHEDAFENFDVTPEGFRRSWIALPLALPFILLGTAIGNMYARDSISLMAVSVFVVLNWLIGVGGLVFFGMLTRQSQQLTATITVSNWFTLWANIILLLPKLCLLLGLPAVVFKPTVEILLFYFTAINAFILYRLWRINLLIVAGIALALLFIDIFSSQIFFGLVKQPQAIANSTRPETPLTEKIRR